MLLSDSMDGVGLLTHSPYDLHDLLLALGLSNSVIGRLEQILVPNEQDLEATSPEVQSAFKQTLLDLSEKTGIVPKAIQPIFKRSVESRKTLFASDASEYLQMHLEDSIDKFPEAVALCRFADSLTSGDLLEASTTQSEIRDALSDLDAGSLLITPALPTPPPSVHTAESPSPLHHFLCLANLLDLPAVTFNRRAGNPSTGIQLIFHEDGDDLVARRILYVYQTLVGS
jgi:Asp-tRNA(Asn)/Glu-tRNA(Gln) amidotransferase A subunit family amidase